MTEKKPTKFVLRGPTAAVIAVGIIATAAVYVLVPDPTTRNGIGWAVAGVFALALAFMRRVLGVVAALVLAIAIPASVTGCSNPGPVLSALELARKVGCATLCPESAGDEASP